MTRLRRTSRRWDDDFGTPRGAGSVDREGVIGCVGREARNVILNRTDEIDSGLRIVDIPVGQDLGDNRTGPINTEMELLPGTLATSTVLGCRPFALADDPARREFLGS